MDERLLFDLFAAVLLALTALAGAYAPVWLSGGIGARATGKRSVVYSLGNMLSAGVMVSAGFCHLLADAERRLHSEGHFPLAPFLCGLGFLLTLVADAVASNLSRRGGKSGGSGRARGGKHSQQQHDHMSDAGDCCGSRLVMMADALNGHSGSEQELCPLPRPSKPQDGAAAAGGKTNSTPGTEDGGNGAVVSGPFASSATAAVSGAMGPELQLRRGVKGSEFGPAVPAAAVAAAVPDYGDDLDIVVHGAGAGPSTGDDDFDEEDDEERPLVQGITNLLHLDSSPALASTVQASSSSGTAGHGGGAAAGGRHGGAGGGVAAVSFITAVLMGIALCFHSLLEGAAMGAEPSVSATFHIFIAIIAHKGLAAYALGSSLVDSRANSRRYWGVILFFVFATPVGIMLGYVVSEISSGDGTASISALAAGTFLYVAAMEVIPKELASQDRWFQKLVALMVGFLAMSLLALWA